VRRAGRAVELLPREYRLLEYLMRHTDRIVTRTMLFEEVLGVSLRPADECHRCAYRPFTAQARRRRIGAEDRHGARLRLCPSCG
jgi:DNA-binding response OmpR family regulator